MFSTGKRACEQLWLQGLAASFDVNVADLDEFHLVYDALRPDFAEFHAVYDLYDFGDGAYVVVSESLDYGGENVRHGSARHDGGHHDNAAVVYGVGYQEADVCVLDDRQGGYDHSDRCRRDGDVVGRHLHGCETNDRDYDGRFLRIGLLGLLPARL